MLTVLHPHMIRDLRDLRAGLWPRQLPNSTWVLIIKITKESILAAKMKGSISIYAVPAPEGAEGCAGIVTAFFDDADEPLTITSPLFEGDPATPDFLSILSSELFDVHLVDENNHELLGYRAKNRSFGRFQALCSSWCLSPFSNDRARVLFSHMSEWFGLRTAMDDENAFIIDFLEPLFPEDLLISDFTERASGFHGSAGSIHSTLERDMAGPAQEMDIVRLLLRVFPAEQVFANPMRTDRPNREFADVMVVTERHLFIVQAKDSPNTEAMLQRKMQRKRTTASSQLQEALNQLGGAVKYARSSDPMTISIGDTIHSIPLEKKTIVGLVVLKEMFDNDAASYADAVLKLVGTSRIPCIPMDYGHLHECTLNLRNEHAFVDGLQAIFNAGRDNGMFPRLRFGLTNPDKD